MSLIKARVKPGNTYGRTHHAGDIIEVTAEELAQVPHCLEDVTVADALRVAHEEAAADKIAKNQAAFEAGRNAQIAARKASEEAMRLRAKNQIVDIEAQVTATQSKPKK